MKADNIKLFDFLSQDRVIFDIPVFQRNYEWHEQQCQQLFDDLRQLVDYGGEHFLGTFVYVRESADGLGALERIIDGQQRLTSCMLLLKAMVDVDAIQSKEIMSRYLTNEFWDKNQNIKLKPVERDRPAFRAVMNGTIAEYNGASKVIENYEFFKRCILKSQCSVTELFTAMRKMNIVYIELDDSIKGENPQVIFESLNSTGVSLSPTDLVRNFLLMRLDEKSQETLYREYWLKIEGLFSNNVFTEFLRHYLICKMHTLVNQNAVYDTYKRYYADNEFTTKDALKELYQYASHYHVLLTETAASSQFNHILAHINIMDKKVIYPYLMKLLNMQSNDMLTWNEVIEIMKVWESYLFRRIVCGVASNGLNRVVISLLKHKSTKSEIDFVMARLLTTNFPTDAQVREDLLTLDIYGKRRDISKLALELLEEHHSKETVSFDDAQVEHIMPQSLTNDWKIEVNNAEAVNQQYGGTLGNLTLTKYNQEMSNKLFRQKVTYYSKSNISLTRDIAESFDQWGQADIIARTKTLGNELIGILARPQNVVTKATFKGEHPIDENVDVTGTKPTRLTIDSKDYSVESWRELLWMFLDYAWSYDSASFLKLNQVQSLGRLFDNKTRELRSPVLLQNGVKVESNFSANSILAIVAKISELYGITEFVSYTIR